MFCTKKSELAAKEVSNEIALDSWIRFDWKLMLLLKHILFIFHLRWNCKWQSVAIKEEKEKTKERIREHKADDLQFFPFQDHMEQVYEFLTIFGFP